MNLQFNECRIFGQSRQYESLKDTVHMAKKERGEGERERERKKERERKRKKIFLRFRKTQLRFNLIHPKK